MLINCMVSVGTLLIGANFFRYKLTQADLSQFGRNHLEAGEYLEQIFPVARQDF